MFWRKATGKTNARKECDIMYCIKCGVELADSEKSCPLCSTEVFHPRLPHPESDSLYPQTVMPLPRWNPLGALFVITVLFLLPVLLCLLGDIRVHGGVTWSGYVAGGMVVFYTAVILPGWFRRPNPVVFTPVVFAVIGLYLLYINLFTGGAWFLSFAFPLTGGLALLFTALAALLYYLRQGQLYIFGGFFISLGIFMLLAEFLLRFTFHRPAPLSWSLYPMITLVLLGLMLIVIALCRPLRESLARRFFL